VFINYCPFPFPPWHGDNFKRVGRNVIFESFLCVMQFLDMSAMGKQPISKDLMEKTVRVFWQT
jgi:hypothetical protein